MLSAISSIVASNAIGIRIGVIIFQNREGRFVSVEALLGSIDSLLILENVLTGAL